MLKAAITFFILGVLAMLLGSFGIFGLSTDMGEMILSIFFIFALMSFIGSAEIERKRHKDIH
ncbi:DUF1328 domain-containing protein [Bacteriovorax stolpii]|uniref:DUF1328 domain-containing protein n=1 Tax=Bacteriovorax stolpii TaxID=960 RepID=A0A2K9NUJ6_BACTC|nr:DUF1328 domain-containing protein [Bacteriovorax stolpii]AUN99147.1 DUF1328 domain-containing protein [Bacteriovorax stolpii]QDK40871.1 DUF1328 domain-containing protein [Bacteriovorax stolpii]TDP55319.1 hypothetical protein C8D79_0366 [Bacteriovorax stolpii]